MEAWPVSNLVNYPKNEGPEIMDKWNDSLF
jgi:hypothetical protein